MSKFTATALDPVFDWIITTFEVVSYQKVKIFPAPSTAPFSFRYFLPFHPTCRYEFPMCLMRKFQPLKRDPADDRLFRAPWI